MPEDDLATPAEVRAVPTSLVPSPNPVTGPRSSAPAIPQPMVRLSLAGIAAVAVVVHIVTFTAVWQAGGQT